MPGAPRARISWRRPRPEVTASGGTFADIAVTEAVTDGNLVTAPAWPAHPAWLKQFMAIL